MGIDQDDDLIWMLTIPAVTVSKAVVQEMRRIIEESEVTKEDDRLWPAPDRTGRQELELRIGGEHIHFTVIHRNHNPLHCYFRVQ